MDVAWQFISRTPLWAWVLLAYLITRGVKGLRPAETSLAKLAVVPVLFTGWGMWTIYGHYGMSAGSILIWLAGASVGVTIGWWLLRHLAITVDPDTRRMWRPADPSLLPLLLVTFAVKYAFEASLAVDPALADQLAFRVAHLAASGGVTGIFVGKFMRYYVAASEAADTP